MREHVIGRLFRMTRYRRGWTQEELSARAGISTSAISRIEGGQAMRYRLRTVQRLGDALDLRVEILVTGRGGESARLLDEEHAAIVEHIAAMLTREGWVVVAEPSFNVYGDRGRLDLLAFHPTTGALLIVEVKTEITDLQQLFGSLSVKERLAPSLAVERGWQVSQVATLLAVADANANLRAIRAHPTLFRGFESSRPSVKAWLHAPSTGTRSLLLRVPARTLGRKAWIATKRRVRHRSASAGSEGRGVKRGAGQSASR